MLLLIIFWLIEALIDCLIFSTATGIPGVAGANGNTMTSEMNSQGQNPMGGMQSIDIKQEIVDMKPPPEKKHRQ